MQGAAAAVAGLVFLVRGLAGADRHVVNPFGNAAWFGLFGGVLLGAGWALWRGRRWGRGIAIYAQMLLLPVSWYVGIGSHQWVYAIPLAVICVLILVLLFSRPTLAWLSGAQDSAASAESSGPDTR